MSRLTNQEYLLSEQYKDASRLYARIDLHKRFSTNDYGWKRWVFDQIETLPPHSRVLELGCGPGELWRENLGRIPAGWEITVSDFSPGMLQQAQENLKGSEREFRFEVVDAQEIPFEDERFDAVIANHMLFFVPDRPKALSEIRRVLKAGGSLFATTVGDGHMGEMMELLLKVDPEADTAEAAGRFGLENGPAQLEPFFAEVAVRRYADDLVVTEARPLVDYVLSSDRSAALKKDPAPFQQLLEQVLAATGAIHIRKDTGMLVAKK